MDGGGFLIRISLKKKIYWNKKVYMYEIVKFLSLHWAAYTAAVVLGGLDEKDGAVLVLRLHNTMLDIKFNMVHLFTINIL